MNMAAAYSTQTYTIPSNQLNFYSHSGQPSPVSSTSPQSPRLHDPLYPNAPNPTKQLRPLKSPLYVPAVLRPTEHFPVLATPMTPPKSTRASLEHLEDRHENPLEQSDLDIYLQQGMAQQEDLGDVTGPPSTDHWKPDELSDNCDAPQCRTNFNVFVRRHHCRHCGHIFCSSHSSKTIPLDQAAQFHPDGHQVRACEACHRQYQRWDTARSMHRKNSGDDNDSESIKTATPTVNSSGHNRTMSKDIGRGIRHHQQPQQPAVANSVPKDWAWSTF